MSLTLTGLESIITNCIENELKIVIICDREVSSIVEEHCDDYDLEELHNVICDYIPYEHRNSGYAIVIDCQDGEYEYYIDFYGDNTILIGTFDEIHIVGKEFNGFDWDNSKLYFEIGVKHGDMIVDEDDLPITQEEHDRWVKAECGSSCVECCLDCSDYECEWNGNIEDCDCDECYEYKEDMKSSHDNHEECIDECEDEECECCTQCDENRLLVDYAERILFTNGCPECVMDIVMELTEHMKHVGWEAHKEYMIEQLCDEE